MYLIFNSYLHFGCKGILDIIYVQGTSLKGTLLLTKERNNPPPPPPHNTHTFSGKWLDFLKFGKQDLPHHGDWLYQISSKNSPRSGLDGS